MKIEPFFYLILVLSSSCDPYDSRLTIVNESADSVYYIITSREDVRSLYNQKLVDQGVNFTYKNYIDKLPQGGGMRHKKFGSAKAWEHFIEKVCENKRLHIFTFDIDTLKRYQWKEITDKGYFKKKTNYSLSEIEEKHWEIILD